MKITRLVFAPVALSILAIACGPSAPEGCDQFVTPGGDDQTAIQTALIDAGDGDTVCLGAGTFTLTDPIEISNLSDFTLKGAGMDQTTLNFDGQAAGGTGIDMMNMTRVVVADLAIRDAAGNGLRIIGSDQVVVRRVSSGWTHAEAGTNGKYAIYPVSSTNVLVDESEAFGSADAGIYVGQTENCVVRNSHAHGNVAGIEIENSLNCEVFGNDATGNVGGILVFELPDLAKHGGGTLVHDNTITDNNLYNFAEGGTVTYVPRGTGMFILAANDVEIRDNTITGNEGAGLAVISWGTAEALGVGTATDPTYDPWTEGIDVHDNTFQNNGTMPGGDGSDADDPLWQVRALLIAQGFDVSAGLETIVWDSLVKDGSQPSDVLCIQNNGDATFRSLDVVNLVNMTSPMSNTDVTPHDCTMDPRPAVTRPFEG